MATRARPKPSRTGRKPRRPDRRLSRESASATRLQSRLPRRVPAPPAPLLPQPDPEALGLFQQGVDALQRHAYDAAADRFRALLSRHPGERALLERARVYLALCDRERRQRPELRTTEERMTAATAAFNNGNDVRAESLARQILRENSRHDLALYLLASIEARRGRDDLAMEYLAQAVDISPEARAQARHDPDFESLRNLERFRALTELPPPAASRRARRVRSDR